MYNCIGMYRVLGFRFKGLGGLRFLIRGYHMSYALKLGWVGPNYYRCRNNYHYHFEVHLRYHNSPRLSSLRAFRSL